MGPVVASEPITYPPTTCCRRKLAPGAVMRCPTSSPYLVGYYIACPACRYIATYLHDEYGFEERGEKYPRELVSSKKDPICYGCTRRLHIEGGRIETIGSS